MNKNSVGNMATSGPVSNPSVEDDEIVVIEFEIEGYSKQLGINIEGIQYYVLYSEKHSGIRLVSLPPSSEKHINHTWNFGDLDSHLREVVLNNHYWENYGTNMEYAELNRLLLRIFAEFLGLLRPMEEN